MQHSLRLIYFVDWRTEAEAEKEEEKEERWISNLAFKIDLLQNKASLCESKMRVGHLVDHIDEETGVFADVERVDTLNWKKKKIVEK